MDDVAYDVEYDRKIEEISEEYAGEFEDKEIGETVNVGSVTVTICDEDGETCTKPVKNILLPADFTIEGGEDKVLRFKTEDEEERFVIDLPITIAKEIAKRILF